MATRSKKPEHEPRHAESDSRAGDDDESLADDAVSASTNVELEQRFADAIEPVIADVPEHIMAAIEPAIHHLEESMAQVVQERAQEVLALDTGSRTERSSDRIRESAPSDAQDHAKAGRTSGPAAEDREEAASTTSQLAEGESHMPTRTTQNRRQQSRSKSDDKQERSTDNGDQSPEREEQGSGRPTYRFDAAAAARVGLLNLANTMRDYGAIYQAINAYERILIRYPDTGAANVATEELVNLAGRLQKEGKIYTALNIFNKLEQYV